MAAPMVATYVMKLKDMTKGGFSAINKSLRLVTSAVFSLKSGFVLLAGVAGMGMLIKQSMNATDNLAKMSRTLGLSVSNLSRLRHAASLGGMANAKLDKAIQKLSVNMADMAKGTGLAKDEFNKYGIAVTNNDGSLRSIIDVLGDVSDATKGITNSAEKATLAYRLFGARGAEMINVIEGGAEAMHKTMREADLLGLVMTDSMVKGVEAANDSITRLGTFLTTSFNQAVANLAPLIEKVTDNIREWFTEMVVAEGGVDKLAISMATSMINAAKSMLVAFQEIGNGLINFVSDMREALPNFMGGVDDANRKLIDLSGAVNVLDRSLASFKKAATEAKKPLEDLTKQTEPTYWDAMKAGFQKYADAATTGTLNISNITKNAMEGIEDGLTNMIMGIESSFDDLIRGLVKDLIKLQIRMSMLGLLKGMGVDINAMGLAPKARGGHVNAGQSYLVGERGAEIFKPTGGGKIIPNHQLDTVSGNVRSVNAEINFNVQAIDAASFNNYLVNNKGTIESIINASLTSNGSVRRTIRQVV